MNARRPDNDCIIVDEGCDDDLDGFCDAAFIVVGACDLSNGGGDCNDFDGTVAPGIWRCAMTKTTCGLGIDVGCDDV